MSTQAVSEELRYPVGKAQFETGLSEARRKELIGHIAAAPVNLRHAVQGLTKQQLDTPYRPGGWTVRQLVHHVPDSHMNAYIRFKLALTEENPTIKTYEEAKWAELADAASDDLETSLCLLECVHKRWDRVLRAMTAEDFKRPLVHPENGPMTLEGLLCMYAWHSRHHVAHVTKLRERMGW